MREPSMKDHLGWRLLGGWEQEGYQTTIRMRRRQLAGLRTESGGELRHWSKEVLWFREHRSHSAKVRTTAMGQVHGEQEPVRTPA